MKAAIVGCGSIGSRYAAYLAEAGIDLLLFDKCASRLEKAAASTGGHAVNRLDDIVATRPDAAIVATPPLWHRQVAESLLGSVGALLVEKPLAPTVDDAVGLVEAAARTATTLFVVSNMRFHPAVSVLRDHLAEIGPVLSASAHFGSYLPDMRAGVDYKTLYAVDADQGGGITLDCIHEFDYLDWLVGPVTSVQGNAGLTETLEVLVEDRAAYVMETRSGCLVTLSLDFLHRVKQRGCKLVGRDGVLEWRSVGKAPERCSVRLFRPGDEIGLTLFEDSNLAPQAPHRHMIGSLIHALETKHPADSRLSRGSEGVRAVRLACGSRRAASERRVVDIGND